MDDIFFKENLTKSSLYKVEVRLQKLEEMAYESVTKLNSLSNFLRLTSTTSQPVVDLANNDNNNNKIAFTRFNSLRKARPRSNTISFDNSMSNSKNRTSLFNKKATNVSFKIEPDISLIHSDNPTCLIKNRRPKFDDSHLGSENTSHQLLQEISIKKTHKSSDPEDEQEVKKIFQLGPDEENLELNYLKNYDLIAARKTSNASLLSQCSRNSLTKKQTTELEIVSKPSKYLDEDIMNELDEDSTEHILNEIYQSHEGSQQQLQRLVGSQTSYNFEQSAEFHPFVYLHSVIHGQSRANTEYTSITDCIDTNAVDRPPSPQMFTNCSESNVTVAFYDLKKNSHLFESIANGNLSNINEATRSHVARQESEILRLAEESQHVIISQLVNKIVKQASFNEDDDQPASTVTTNDKTLTDKEEIQQTVSASVFNENLIADKKKKYLFDAKTSTINEEKSVLTSTTFNEEDETRCKRMNSVKKSGKGLTNKIPLNPLDRKSSQIFYAQSQAQALCGPEDHEEDYTNNESNQSNPVHL